MSCNEKLHLANENEKKRYEKNKYHIGKPLIS